MRAVAREVTRAAGAGVSAGATGEREWADRLMRDTVALARACAQDSRTDLGIGAVHLPEPSRPRALAGDVPQEVLAARCRGAIATRYPGSSPTPSCARWSAGSRTSSRSSPSWATRPTS